MNNIKSIYYDIEEMFFKWELSVEQTANALDLNVEFVEVIIDSILVEELFFKHSLSVDVITKVLELSVEFVEGVIANKQFRSV